MQGKRDSRRAQDAPGTRPRTQPRWFLSSRVARRVFLLFILCALLPLLLFAGFALRNVTGQLERQAEVGLHEECKALGMTALERLGYLREDLALMFSGNTAPSSSGQPGLAPDALRKRVESRFAWVALGSADSELLGDAPQGVQLPFLTAEAREHLDRQSALITFSADQPRRANLVLVVALTDQPETRYAFGQVRSSYLFGGDGVLKPTNDVIVLTDEGDVLFATGEDVGFGRAVRSALEEDPTSGHFGWRGEEDSNIASYRTMFTRPQLYHSFVLAESRPRSRVTAPVEAFKEIFVLFSVLTLLGAALGSLVQIRRSLVPIEQLQEAAGRIREQDFSARVHITTRDEFRDLGGSFNAMAEGLERYVGTMDTLHRIGIALTAERDSDKLIQIVAEGTLAVTTADLVLLHGVDDDGETSVLHASSHTIADDLVSPAGEAMAEDALRAPSPAARAISSGETVSIEDIADATDVDCRLYEPLQRTSGQRACSVLCVPLCNHENERIGVLELIGCRDSGAGPRFSSEEVKVAESLASQAAVALTKNKLVDDFRGMFDALTELIATAIDEKSRYTADHCRRVPVLTMVIADAVCEASSGVFQDFTFTEDQLYELRVAALLHDCGKVVTPVHVVDKATKLETIFDRIDLVSARFDVARRDLEIDHLRRALAKGTATDSEVAAMEHELSEELAAIERDRDFIRHTNVGGEYMAPENQGRVSQIAENRSWVDAEGTTRPLLTEDEVNNLCISKGTLTAEEREVINYHVVATIKMLEQLPYPTHLRGVPSIAGAHHERMDGKGYPLGLKRGQIALQGRILGIADVFEALTAKDRPYKPGKTLTETLTILGRMAEEGHVDPDLFQLFVESGAYLGYAEEFLDPEQVDAVDLDSIPGYEPPAQRSSSRRAG